MAWLLDLSNIYTVANPFKLYDNIWCWQLTAHGAEILRHYEESYQYPCWELPTKYQQTKCNRISKIKWGLFSECEKSSAYVEYKYDTPH